ncbi:MAG: ABC transporter substrate-binding protein [Candidatus Poribacteria bacterium]|nr:ABC transporter substrate-binding protein [Candidatus Poribacteria bacterium]
MNTRIFRFALCVLLALSVAWLSGCEKIMDMAPPPDGETTLKVGLIHPYPNYTSFGKGAELAQAEINAAGGVLGMQVELIFKEETTDTVVQSATELVEMDNVVAILGPLFSSHAVKVGPVATVPVLLGATRAEVTADATDPNDFMFLVAGSNVLQANLLAKVAVEQLNARYAGMIWQNKDVYSEGFVQAFGASFQELVLKKIADEFGLVIDPTASGILNQQVYESGDTMFDVQLARMKVAYDSHIRPAIWRPALPNPGQLYDTGPDVLLLASFPPANPLIMKQARDMGIKSIFIGSDGWDDPLMSTTLEDNEPVDGYYCTNLDPDAVQFNSAYTAKYGSVDGIAATGYDAMKILAIAIETVGSTDDPVAIRDAISAITNYEGATSISSFDDNRNPIKSVGVRQILNGVPQDDIIVASPE